MGTPISNQPYLGNTGLDHNGFQSRIQKLGVMDIGSGHNHTRWTTCLFKKNAPLGPCIASISGVSTNQAPQTSLDHSCVGRLTFPVHVPQLLTIRLDECPNPQKKTTTFPSLKGAMDSVVIVEFLRQPVPLCPASHPVF